MQKPTIHITDVSFESGLPTRPDGRPSTIAYLTYTFAMGDETYTDLQASGDGAHHAAALRAALTDLDVTVYLDAVFTAAEVAILQVAYAKDKAAAAWTDHDNGWLDKNTLAHQASSITQSAIPTDLADAPANRLAQHGLLQRVTLPVSLGVHYKITTLGREIVDAHRQFMSDEIPPDRR